MKRARSNEYEEIEGPDELIEPKIISLHNQPPAPPTITCTLPPFCNIEPTSFSSNNEFESHYYKFHNFECSICRKVFPSQIILELHITELHDSFASARLARGEKIYGCLIEDCDRFCSTPQKRRRHVIDKHKYPENFDFKIIQYGLSKNQTSLLR